MLSYCLSAAGNNLLLLKSIAGGKHKKWDHTYVFNAEWNHYWHFETEIKWAAKSKTQTNIKDDTAGSSILRLHATTTGQRGS